MTPRDHIFISYAIEDVSFGDWLALRLTEEGYKVWYDRMTLLGGESYPRDIDRAIAERAFRVLGVISRASIPKANPIKERTQALNVGKRLGIDFLIPLKIESLSPAELGWQLSDLTYVPFDRSWSLGLGQLFKALAQLGAPRDQNAGRTRVSGYLQSKECVSPVGEPIWTNLLPVADIPNLVHRYKARNPAVIAETDKVWPIAQADERTYWAFSPPEEGLGVEAIRVGQGVAWRREKRMSNEAWPRIISILIRRAVELDCARRGLAYNSDDRVLYFQGGRLPSDRLPFKGWEGEARYLQVVGERSRGRPDGSRHITRYSNAFQVRPSLSNYGPPVLRILPTVRATSVDGVPVKGQSTNRARKSITKGWWNYEWLARVMAYAGWLTGGRPRRVLIATSEGNLALDGQLLKTTCPLAIDEAALQTQVEPMADDDDDVEDPDSEEQGLRED